MDDLQISKIILFTYKMKNLHIDIFGILFGNMLILYFQPIIFHVCVETIDFVFLVLKT